MAKALADKSGFVSSKKIGCPMTGCSGKLELQNAKVRQGVDKRWTDTRNYICGKCFVAVKFLVPIEPADAKKMLKLRGGSSFSP